MKKHKLAEIRDYVYYIYHPNPQFQVKYRKCHFCDKFILENKLNSHKVKCNRLRLAKLIKRFQKL